MTTQTDAWTPTSWRSRPIKQQPQYADQTELASALGEIAGFPPLVFAGEVESLKHQIAEAADGRRFLLQGGDCAERFQDCNPEAIKNKLKIILKMSLVLCYGSRQPVIRVGRIAGQYAKPRSADTETVDGQTMEVFRGDCINSFEPDPVARRPDPRRLLKGYHYAAMSLNYIRALIAGGFADLHHPDQWNLDFFGKSAHRARYTEMVGNIHNAIAFMESLGAVRQETLGRIDFYTSHEGLLLGFEEALTRFVDEYGRHYNLGAHMLWIGDRTRELGGAHIEYFRGIANPIGLKVGPSASPDQVVELIRRLNPNNEAGRIVLISRYGVDKVSQYLPAAVRAVKAAGLRVLWSADPMHGNIIKTEAGIKTRDFDAILGELKECFRIHAEEGSRLGGVHFELTGDDVTECIGGAEDIKAKDLQRNYETFCDPRLNYSQSLEMAFLISEMLTPRA